MSQKSSSQFGIGTASVYLFNLVVGTGVLALPSVLISGGWLLGGIFISIVGFLSYVTFTFVVESMAASNALLELRKEPPKIHGSPVSPDSNQTSSENGDEPLLGSQVSIVDRDIFEIKERTEFGQMAGMYYNRVGLIAFFSILIVYLYGDGVIYSTVVVRSLIIFTFGQDKPVWAFDLFLCTFFAFILPFCLFDFQKTKILQMTTVVIRNVALLTILVLAFRAALKTDHDFREIPATNFKALPNLFGGAVYSFMCHHSIPGLVSPIANKKNLMWVAGVVYAIIFVMYMALYVICLVAFGADVLDPVTFNFPPQDYGFIGDALVLFPVFTLTSNFPIMMITLRNNIDALLTLTYGEPPQVNNGDFSWPRRIILTLVAVTPPFICGFVAEHFGLSVDSLVGTAGAFAGCIIMFIMPASFVYCSRRVVKESIANSETPMKFASTSNTYASPFKAESWLVVVIGWALMTLVFNAVLRFSSLWSTPTT